MKQQPQGFSDPKTFVAIGVIVVFMMGWQYYLYKKYPKASESGAAPARSSVSEVTPPASGAPQAMSRGSSIQDAMAGQKPVSLKEQTFVFNSNLYEVEVSSKGMGIKRVTLKRFKERSGEPVHFGASNSDTPQMFYLAINDQTPLDFDLRDEGGGVFSGIHQGPEVEIKRTLRFLPDSYGIEIQTSVRSSRSQGKIVRTLYGEKLLPPPATSFFSPSINHQNMFMSTENKHWHTHLSQEMSASDLADLQHPAVGVFGFDSLYFLAALADQSASSPRLSIQRSTDQMALVAAAEYSIPGSGVLDLNQRIYFGPKESDWLASVDSRLKNAIDFGWFGWIGHPLLKVMRWFYSITHNWGLAIILLTLLVRFVVLPTNIISYRSMRKMSEIQPLLKAVQQRYKDDPAGLQKETFALYKTYKVNPLSGCLPILLQIPIFLALYRVFQNSVDLYQAPFAFWIADLSLKDPFYVFPLLLTGAMYIQQLLTPSTLDPTQQKVMKFIPIFFGLFMLPLPSALTLYMLVSTLFGIVQQWVMTKESRAGLSKVAAV